MKHRFLDTMYTMALGIALIAVTGNDAHSATGFPGDRSWAVGMGMISNSSPFLNHQTQTFPMPFVIYAGERLHVTGPDVGYTLLDSPALALDATASIRFESFDPDKSPAFAEMNERDPAFEVGLKVDARVLALSYRADVSGAHGGHEIRLTHTRPFPIRFGAVSPRLSATWKSRDLVDYYYGVRDSESTASRAAYRPGSSLQFGAGLDFVKQISWNWMVVGSASHEFLSSTIKDSPIVGDSGQTTLTFAFVRIL